MTWADIHFIVISELKTRLLENDFLKEYPALNKLYHTVQANPKIKAYLDKRPKTKF